MPFFGRHIIMSPVILLIIITFCTNSIAKHKIRHHRDRFKRQHGENLYLPDSYVTDGGDGPDAGPWTDWSAPSLCSRTCGGGVSTQYRQCQEGYTCQGPTSRSFTCNTQDCPDIADYRAQQCSEFDGQPFEGVYYQWIPYTKARNPCELNCMPRGERFYYRHRDQVVDGTRCNDETFDVCVQGKCQPVGCDRMLGSYAREDQCRVCGGDGSTCKTVTGRLDTQDFVNGYNDILLIPAGATNIVVQEIEPSNNYLAVRNTSGYYYLNGNWRIDFPRTLEFAGCKFHYERYPQGFSAPDKISCLGPIEEPLFIVLLLQDVNVGVDYEYSIPTNIQPGSESETYVWTFDQFTPCTSTCGGGTQSRNVSCVGRKTLEPADRGLCDSHNEPPSTQRCAEVPCEAQWVPYPWEECSAPCGEGGTQTRAVSCQQIVSNGYSTIVDESECMKSQPKPPVQQRCNEGKICAKWHLGHWKPCDHLCGEGKETREVRCYIEEDGKKRALEDSDCPEPKPEVERACNVRPCEGVDWVTSQWSGCDKCGLTNETRKVQCATAKGEIHPDNLCEENDKPESVRQCKTMNQSCEYLWYASQWSECSAECGEGIQTRSLFCGVVTESGDVKKVEDDKCDSSKSYDMIKNCTAEVETCPGEWFGGPWSECSKPCGGGQRTRQIVCLKNLTVVPATECNEETIMFRDEECNVDPCSEDAIIPTDVTKSVDESEPTDVTEVSDGITLKSGTSDKPEEDDEYETVLADECDDGEWVDEDEHEGETEPTISVDLGSSTESGTTESGGTSETPFSLDDLMLSDATASDEFTATTGSGDEELISTVSGGSSAGTSLSESTLEGSGETSSSVIFETDTTIELDSSSHISEGTESSFSETTVESSSISTDETSVESSSSSSTDSEDISSTQGATESSTEGDVSGSTDGETSISTDMSSSSTDDEMSSESVSTLSSTDSSSSSESSDDTTETTDSTPSSISTDTSESSASTETTDSSDTTTDMSFSSSTDSSSTTDSSTDSSSDSSSETTESSSSDMTGTTSSQITESSTDGYSEPEVVGESDFGSQKSTSKPTDSTDISSSSMEETDITTEFAGTTETSTEFTGSTESSSETLSSSGSSSAISESSTESSTEFTGSTESTSEFTGSTESTTEFTGSTETSGSTEFDIWSSTTESGATEETWETSSITDIFETRKPRLCKRRKQKDCKKTKHGCCPDKLTPAQGPFDKGCPNPETCKESKYGCCEDGVSAALGKNFKGCPPTYCNETLFGCCPDNKTPSQGNNNEGCPPPPPECLKSKYGCCADNSTAKGPNKKGCPETQPILGKPQESCTNSTYGCCPDQQKAAEGPNYRGCDLPCSEGPYGCCSDGVTPAHGYSGEGCCLVSPFGCCPDNILPAQGLNLEGCGCQYSPYGCCPDNKTAARGYNKEGCGCQYTEHGCCPDSYTPAAGSDYEGCLCHTFQFGCCPDGVTAAKGPHQQGCGCRNTEFGCCSDESTPAQGPDFAGCGCDSSKFGCCPDGTTEAQGENFEGCTDIPANLQDSCSLPKERGSCRNYTVKWFFDMEYGGCSRFWYGGCEGNDNRFRSKEECEGICIKPEGTDRCKLPKVPGPCEGYYLHWYYDEDRKNCAQFVYGGCLGNNNRFETREECMSLCVKDDSVDGCEQKKEEGPCHGNYRRWYFDKESQSCQQFIYGGCKGNNNNFPTEEACKQKCAEPGRKKDHCSLPRAQGSCEEKDPRWYYDTPEKRCLPFYYSGCNGNDNNFISREACETDCPPEIEKDLCHLAADIGTCGQYTQRWYYDTREKMCRQFYYGGCGGNDNNFLTEQECDARCNSKIEPPSPQTNDTSPQQPFTIDQCFLVNDPGPCRDQQLTRYYYDRAEGVCKGFIYGGCEGNANNFASRDECLQYCGNAEDLCSLPPVVGPCDSEYVQYYYDAQTDTCQQFVYGGCEGNYNRFADQASCEQRCRRRPPDVQTPAPAPGPSELAMCYEPADPGNCTDSYTSFFFDASRGTCIPFTYTGCGGNANRYNSEEQCERQCGKFRSQDVCNMPQDSGPCEARYIKYYYDRNLGRCERFIFGGCDGNGNRFSSEEECQSVCVTHHETRPNDTSAVICQLPPDQGSCQDVVLKRWYFDFNRRECIAFPYTGCGGNFNNFYSYESCNDFCHDYLAVTEASTEQYDQLCQSHFEECATIRCAYGIEAFVDQDGCKRCQCHNPCANILCPENTQCAIDLNRNRTSRDDPNFIAVCRDIVKQGECPRLQPSETNCDVECRTDADCALNLKCCTAGCRWVCVEPKAVEVPAELVTKGYPTYTDAPIPSIYQPPRVDVETFEPEVNGAIGDHVVLHCAVTGNPTPRISWKKDNLIIDGTQARYRIKLDQSLQIITLHKTDSGVYLCTADNSIGEPITQPIKLNVLDSDPRPASVLDQEEPNVLVSLNAPATLNCLALGYPFPAVTWWKDDSLIPLKTSQFEVRKDYSLLIHSVKLSNLGIYTCQAYNGVGKAASWSVIVRAQGPYYSTNPDDEKYLQYVVNPPEAPSSSVFTTPSRPVYRPPPPPYIPPDNEIPHIVPNNTAPDVDRPGSYPVPVRVNITLENTRFPEDGEIIIPCNVDGFPTPQVKWYKDGVPIISPTERIYITNTNTLRIQKATKADSGTYQCEAANSYSRASSSTAISVEGMYIDPNCKDNRFLANCALIVKGKLCSHHYYAKFCCRSCTEAGLLPSKYSQNYDRQSALDSNLV